MLGLSIRAETQETPAPLFRRIMRATLLVVPVCVVIAGVTHRDIKRAIGAKRDRHRAIHAPMIQIGSRHQLPIIEILHHRFALIGNAIAIRVAPAHHFIREHRIEVAILYRHAERIVRGRLGRKSVHFVFEPVPIRIAQEMKAPVVSAGKEPSIGRVLEVVQAGELDRQFPHRESRHKHPHTSRIRALRKGRLRLLVRHRRNRRLGWKTHVERARRAKAKYFILGVAGKCHDAPRKSHGAISIAG